MVNDQYMRILRVWNNVTKKISFVEQDGDTLFDLKGDILKRCTRGQKLSPKKIRILPICNPSKIVLVGLNYRDHARELGLAVPKEPVIFLKPPTAIIGNGERIAYPSASSRVDYEAELAIVIKKEAWHLKEKDVEKYILGYTCLNDVTARDLQKKDGQWTRSKSFDTFCPIGPHIQTKLSIDEAESVTVRSLVNGVVKQDSSTRHFIFGIRKLVSFISSCMTLNPFDVISTGTPPGVGPLVVGDTVQIEIEKIGTLTNKVVRGC